ncbi:hypothetical protein NL676_011356 [Syzygium grande]|nr:hypothetical protein NL676_011356 [Syzygium grande]
MACIHGGVIVASLRFGSSQTPHLDRRNCRCNRLGRALFVVEPPLPSSPSLLATVEEPSSPAPDLEVRRLHIWTNEVTGVVVQARVSKPSPLPCCSQPWMTHHLNVRKLYLEAQLYNWTSGSSKLSHSSIVWACQICG